MKFNKPAVWIPFCFLLLNGLGLWKGLAMWEKHLRAEGGLPGLVQSPADREMLSERETIDWVWDQAVVGADQLGDWSGEAPVQFDPSVAGKFSWVSDRQLRFMPLQDWPVAQVIRMDLSVQSAPRAGRTFLLEDQVTLLGPPQAVLSMEPYVTLEPREIQMRLRLKAPVSRLDLQKHVALLDDQDKALEIAIQETPQPDEFLISTAWWSASSELRLWVKSGLPSLSGSAGAMLADRVFKVKAPQSFSLMGLEVEQPSFGSAEVELSFSEVPALQSVMDGLRIEPEVKFSVGSGRWWRSQSCRVTGDFVPGQKYRLILSEGIRSEQGNVLTEALTRELIIPHREPGLRFAHDGWILNAGGANRVQLETENEGAVHVQLHQIHINNLVEFAVRASGRDTWYYNQNPEQHLGREIWSETLTDLPDGAYELALGEPLAVAGQGVYRLAVEGRNSRKSIDRLIVLSDLGLMARQHGDRFVVWALRLDSAEPVADLEVTLWSDTRQPLARGTTNADGLTELIWEADAAQGNPLVLIAKGENAVGMLTLDKAQPFPGKNGERPYLQSGNEAFVYTSRGMYRPSETINARAIVRGKDFALPGEFPVEWRLQNQAGMTVWKQTVTLSSVGTAEAEIALAPEWPNGRYRLLLSLPGDDAPLWGEAAFYLESFVPPQVVVKADSPDGEEAVGPSFAVTVDAQMLYGAPAAAHLAKAVLTVQSEIFRSSEYPDYSFSDDRKDAFGTWTRPVGEGKTDENGQFQFQVQVPEHLQGPSALRAVVGISVKEFSGREAVTVVSRRVDRVPYYVGVNTTPLGGGELRLDVVGVNPAGDLIQENQALELSWYRLNWQQGYRRDAQGRFTYFSDEIAVKEGGGEIGLDAGRAQRILSLTPDAVYRVVVRDPQSGFSASRNIYLGNAVAAPERADQVVLNLDKESYVAGEEAVLTIYAPFPGQVLVSVESEKLLDTERLLLTDNRGTTRFRVPVSAAPNLWVRATVFRPQPGNGAAPVVRSDGAIPLRMRSEALPQPLTLVVNGQLMPSQEAVIRLTGTPGAEVVVAGVDEGILLLSQFETPDPLGWFLALRRVISQTWDSFDDLMPELGPARFAGEVKMGGGMGAALRKRLNPVDAKRFQPLSWWSGVHTFPESGEVVLKMPMPEFSGTVRWMAVQVSSTGMGAAEAFSKVGRDLIVQQSLPLFLAPGDESFWTFRLHNRSESARTVTLFPSVKGPVELAEGGQVLSLAAGEVRQVSIKIKGRAAAGKALCTLGVKAGEDFWQEQLELAVRPLAAYEERMRSWVLLPGQSLKIEAGDGMFPGTSERWLTGSGLPVMQLAASRAFLLRYPYGCVEQTVSAASVGLYMPDWADGSGAGARAQVEAGIMALWKKQRQDGGFGYWHHRDQVSVPGTFAAMAFLLEAKAQGYEVNARALDTGLNWTRNWLLSEKWRSNGGWENLYMIQACRVLALAGQLDAGWLQRIRERREDLNGYSRVLAAECMVLGGQRPLAMEMLAGLSRVDEGYGWHSGTSGNAELLRVLLRIDPQDGRIPPLVERVLAARNAAGRWANTYENAAVIRAFTAYAKMFPQTEGEIKLGWASADKQAVFLSEIKVALTENQSGTLTNQGEVPMFVALQSGGIPREPVAVENRFRLDRSLIRLNGKVLRNGEAVRSGEMFLLRFRISGVPRRSDYLVLDQGLPAGLEALPASQQDKAWQRLQVANPEKGIEPRHLEVRDDRLYIFPHRVDQELRIFDVLVRAVSSGSYIFPAVVAQDMYDEAMIFRGDESRLEVRP